MPGEFARIRRLGLVASTRIAQPLTQVHPERGHL
jgi:hypothetical protein